MISTGVISTLVTNKERMVDALNIEMLSTDVAYYLVRKGLAFRQAHSIAGEIVKLAELKNCDMSKLTIHDLKNIHSAIDTDIIEVWHFEKSVEQYKVKGGTAKESVLSQIEILKNLINI